MGEKTINYFASQVDKMVIGKWLGMDNLGLYNIAWNLIIFPITRINPIFTQVAFSVFSKFQNDSNKLSNYYARLITVIMNLNTPLLLGIFLTANEIVYVLYGTKCEKASGIIRILSLSGILKTFANPGGAIILAKGRADISFYINIFWIIIITSFSYHAAITFGTLESMAYSQLLATALIGIFWHYLVAKYGEIAYINILRIALKAIILSLAMSFIVYFIGQYIEFRTTLTLIIKSFIGVLSYILLLLFFNRKTFDLVTIWRK